jgi:hypothetical protein
MRLAEHVWVGKHTPNSSKDIKKKKPPTTAAHMVRSCLIKNSTDVYG